MATPRDLNLNLILGLELKHTLRSNLYYIIQSMGEYLKIKSINNIDVFYDLKSLGIAILDPRALSEIQNDLRKIIQNPVLIIEVNPTKLYYIRGDSIRFQIATVVIKDGMWYIYNFIFDGTLEIAQSKFKKGKIIYGRPN